MWKSLVTYLVMVEIAESLSFLFCRIVSVSNAFLQVVLKQYSEVCVGGASRVDMLAHRNISLYCISITSTFFLIITHV